MGYAECNVVMESRSGSVSSGLGSSSSVRRHTSKSSPFCPCSSSKLTQSIIKDHMISHYKKVYSAKAAIDASVPKSLLCSVKYNDRIRQERQRKGSRPQSAHSLPHKNSRTSSSSSLSCSSVQYDESPYYYSRSSMVSSPRFTTTFHAKKTAYSSCKINSHPTRPASETKYWSPDATLNGKQSTCSLVDLGEQSSFRTFQDPVQKTYSGDLLQRHSQHFTEHKPFTPQTLKSEKSSYLSKYRYYRAPERTSTQDYSNRKLTREDTHLGSTKIKEHTKDFDEPSQEFVAEQEWSEDDFNDSYLLSLRQADKSQTQTFMDNSPRFSPEGGRYSKLRSVSAEEEELLYLEFISEVTEDILSKGHISDRVIDRVMKHHINMNLKKLDEGKMRYLLEVLREDLKEPANMSNSRVELEIKHVYQLDSMLGATGSHVKTKEDNDLLSYGSLIKSCNSLHDDEPLMVSTPIRSPERFTPTETKEDYCKDVEEEDGERGSSPPLLSEQDARVKEEHHHQTDTKATNKVSNEKYGCADETSDKDQATIQLNGQSEEVEDLGRNLSELLHVSSSAHDEQAAALTENTNHVPSGSDDDF